MAAFAGRLAAVLRRVSSNESDGSLVSVSSGTGLEAASGGSGHTSRTGGAGGAFAATGGDFAAGCLTGGFGCGVAGFGDGAGTMFVATGADGAESVCSLSLLAAGFCAATGGDFIGSVGCTVTIGAGATVGGASASAIRLARSRYNEHAGDDRQSGDRDPAQDDADGKSRLAGCRSLPQRLMGSSNCWNINRSSLGRRLGQPDLPRANGAGDRLPCQLGRDRERGRTQRTSYNDGSHTMPSKWASEYAPARGCCKSSLSGPTSENIRQTAS